MSSKLATTKSTRRQPARADLGDLSFDDWYDTPVFEAEPDERLEQLATSRRAPLRLVAGAMLRLAPDRSARSERAHRPERPERSLREKVGDLLDRWAAMETASQERLEALVLPRRWRG